MSETKITFIDRIRALFARNKEDFWFKHFTDEEKELKRMDVWQLAEVIHEYEVRKTPELNIKRIVAEHMLNVRLAKIQAMPVYVAIIFGLIGVVGGAYLNSLLPKPSAQCKCICEGKNKCGAQNQVNNLVPPVSTPVTGIQPGNINMTKGKGTQNKSKQ